MSISSADLRSIKKAIADRLALVPQIGEVIPSRIAFMDKADFFAVTAPKKTQKQIEIEPVAFAEVFLSVPRLRLDEQNEKIFGIDYTVRLFREGFPSRVDEDPIPDAFRKKILLSEDKFDEAAVNLGYQFREEVTIADLSADVKATILPVNLDGQQIVFGEPEFLPTVSGHYLEMTVSVEVVYDDC